MTRSAARALQYLRVVALLISAGCGGGAEGRDTYTLYRSGSGDPAHREHVATFDAEQDVEYNRKNCELARQLFQSLPAAPTRFWCERGRFHR
jgi:hypothetical protein